MTDSGGDPPVDGDAVETDGIAPREFQASSQDDASEASSESSGTFHLGGALSQGSPAYVRRRADDEILEALRAHRFCYVLNARQMGKSSLRVEAARALGQALIRTATIDVSTLQERDEREWYRTFVEKFAIALKLQSTKEYKDLSKERGELSPPEFLLRFVDQVVLERVAQDLVVFIDEIDSTLNLNFSVNGFFAALRGCHEKRPEDPRYRRLTFVLIGVARPDELARDHRTTPFNVAQRIELEGFTLAEMGPLRAQMPPSLRGDAVIERIIDWTGGQPLLTHKLCERLTRRSALPRLGAAELVALVDDVVEKDFVERWQERDYPEHFGTIRRRFEAHVTSDQKLASQLLTLYSAVLDGDPAAGIESARTGVELELRLMGLARLRGGRLRLANRIYPRIFGRDWVDAQFRQLRPYDEAFVAWQRSGQKDASRLLEGDALAEAKRWSEGRSLPPPERAFLQASEQRIERLRNARYTIATLAAAILSVALIVSIALHVRLEASSRSARENFERANNEAQRANDEAQRANGEAQRANDEAKRANSEAKRAAEQAQRANNEAQRAGEEAKRANELAAKTERARAARDAEAQRAVQAEKAAKAEAERALKAERDAKAANKSLAAQNDRLSRDLAACTLVDQDRARLRGEVDRLRKQCSNVQPRAEGAVGIPKK